MIFYGLTTSAYFNYIFSDVIKFLIVEEKIVTLKLILFLMVYFFMIMVMIFLFIFFIFHLWITLKNFTTYEILTFRKNRLKNSSLAAGEKNNFTTFGEEVSKFDLSPWENWRQVYGCNPLVWFIPINFCRKDSMWDNGINFKLNQKYEYEVVKSV
jgi:hypothetical protein